MKKIIMLVIVACGVAHADDLFHTASCHGQIARGSSCGSTSFAMLPTPNLPSAVLNEVSHSSRSAGLPSGMEPVSTTCPYQANQPSYRPLAGNIPALRSMVNQIEAIPNYQYYPQLAQAVDSLRNTLNRIEEHVKANIGG